MTRSAQDPEDRDAPTAPSLGPLIASAALYGGLAAMDETRRHANRVALAAEKNARRAFSLGKHAPERHASRPGEHPPLQTPKAPHEPLATAIARGRDATTPFQIPRRGWILILRRTWTEMGQDHLGLIAAGVAFYALLALFPALGVAVALAGLVTTPADFVGAIDSVSDILPAEAAQILLAQARQVAGSSGGGLGLAALLGFGLALYSSSRGVMSLIEGLNVTYDEDEKRSFLRLNLTALALTVVVIVGMIVGLTATIVIPAALAIVGVAPGEMTWIGTLRWPILLLGTITGLSILYRFGPSREHARWSWISPGAVLACLLWLAGTAVFAWYAQNFASYNQTFGTLGGAIVLLMWLWLSAYIVLIGAELNAEIEAQTARDSTTGAPMPMGRRGAVKADTLGEPVD
jgi:membrane protein